MGVTIGSPLPSPPDLPIEPVVFLLHMVGPERFPLPVEIRRTQIEHRLGTVGVPAHPIPFQPILHQMPTRPLDHPTTDRVARRQILVIPHPATVPIEVADHLTNRLAA